MNTLQYRIDNILNMIFLLFNYSLIKYKFCKNIIIIFISRNTEDNQNTKYLMINTILL